MAGSATTAWLTAGSGGTPTTVLTTTLTIGTSSLSAGVTARGFTSAVLAGWSPTTFGSLTSAAVTGGRTCVSVYDDRDTTTPAYAAVLTISGFGADPGQSYLYDVTANGVTKLGSAATFYNYSAGTATWNWEDSVVGVLFGFATSGSTTLTIRVP